MPTNNAAFLSAKCAPSLEVKPTTYPLTSANRITIRIRALAINPVDYIIQAKGNMMYTWLKYPVVLGTDLAGEVVEVGSNISRFKVGDRVLGFATGSDPKINDPNEGAFQEYVSLPPDMVTKIPAHVSYDVASVVPLGLATAAAAFYEEGQLGLERPQFPTKSTGKTLLVWGGATSVGCNAIQLGVAAGYEVYATSSPSNFELCKKLGASKVFDYKSKTVIQEIIDAFKGKETAGALAMGQSADACMDILAACEKGNKMVILVTFPSPKEEPKSLVMLRTGMFFVSWGVKFKTRGLVNGVKSNFIFASSIARKGNPIGKQVFVDYLEQALAEGSFVPAPEPMKVGHGVESIQEAMEVHKKGVSAKKVIVTL